MLRESSTSTAMMFCCELSSATVIAGSHNNSSTREINAVSKPQIATARQLRSFWAASARRDHMNHPNPLATLRISSPSTHPGHRPSRTK